jgi:peptidoglycan/LPS O-acetylase OafA/YrhL
MKAPAAPLAALALVYALALPEEHLAWTLFVALVFLPGILAVSVAAGRHRAMPGGALLGRLSYPLYGIHVPLLAIAAGGSSGSPAACPSMPGGCCSCPRS